MHEDDEDGSVLFGSPSTYGMHKMHDAKDKVRQTAAHNRHDVKERIPRPLTAFESMWTGELPMYDEHVSQTEDTVARYRRAHQILQDVLAQGGSEGTDDEATYIERLILAELCNYVTPEERREPTWFADTTE